MLAKEIKDQLKEGLIKNNHGWEIFYKPYLNGHRPNIIAFNKNYGIKFIEYLDIDLRYKYSVEKGLIEQKNTDKKLNPFEHFYLYAKTMRELYLPRVGLLFSDLLKNPGIIDFSIICDGAIQKDTLDKFLEKFTENNTEESKHNMKKIADGFWRAKIYRNEQTMSLDIMGYPIGASHHIDEIVKQILPDIENLESQFKPQKKLLSDAILSDMTSWFKEPEFARELKAEGVELSKDQSRMINNKELAGRRRIRGNAGGGKSLVIAGRANKLAKEGKKVLVVTFNITLIKNLKRETWKQSGDPNNFHITYYHQFIELLELKLGLDTPVKKKLGFNEWDTIRADNLLKRIRDYGQQNLRKMLDIHDLSFNAILIDEAQDFQDSWLKILTHLLYPDDQGKTEFLIAVDPFQNIYNRELSKHQGLGFRRYIDLKDTYRLPSKMINILNRYCDKYFDNDFNISNNAQNSQETIGDFKLEYLTTDKNNAAQICYSAILSMMSASENAISDIVFLTDNGVIGYDVVLLLEQKNIKVSHIFKIPAKSQVNEIRKKLNIPEYDEEDRYSKESSVRNRKLGLDLSMPSIKCFTLHSFKGMESSRIITYFSHSGAKTKIMKAFVSMSRIRKSISGSHLIIISDDPVLEKIILNS